MSVNERIGVYTCHCGTNIAGTVDVKDVAEFASEFEEVRVSKDYRFMCSDPAQNMIRRDIGEEGLTKVVVAACSPDLHEVTFRSVVESAGLNKFVFQMANIREHCSWVTEDEERATEKAKRLVNAAVGRVKRHEPLEVLEVDVVPRTLVVGGGIAGIEAALVVADSAKEVCLVEKTPSIGGHMAQLDKTFPTLDCSSCILTPKMSDAGTHPNINLMTYSEVESIDGHPGNYTVKIEHKARCVTDDCTGCAACEDVCPVYVKDGFNEGLDLRKAIYQPFPQAVPITYTIDKDHCIECGLCVDACKEEGPDAVRLDEKDWIEEVTVGNIIVATGYQLMDPSAIERYSYTKHKDIHTALEIERMIDSTGPTGGKIITSKGEEPETVVIVHCVGSRDENFNEYCSRVCCMYSMKLAHLIKDETGADVFELYMDIRSFGKGYEEFYNRMREEDIIFVRGKSGAINVEKEERGKLLVNCEDTLLQERIEIPTDMVILAPAIEPTPDLGEMANKFTISRSEEGFLMERHLKLEPVGTRNDSIFLAGTCQGPKDISDTVAQGKGAAGEAVKMIDAGTLELEPYSSKIDGDICVGCKTCLHACPFDAIDFDEEEKASRVDETLCKGCGLCSMVCRTGAATHRGFTDEQLSAEIVGVLEEG